MTKVHKDYLGNEIKAGDLLHYAVVTYKHLHMRTARVLGFSKTGMIRLEGAPRFPWQDNKPCKSFIHSGSNAFVDMADRQRRALEAS